MAKQSSKNSDDAATVAEREMPGWKAVKVETTRARALAAIDDKGEPKAGADVVLPSLEKLRRKYLGEDDAQDPERELLDSGLPDDLEVVEMESGDHRKTVAVRRGKVVWSQG